MLFQFFNKERDKKIITGLGIILILMASFIIIKDEFLYQFFPDSYLSDNTNKEDVSDNNCNIAGIKLHGDLWTYFVGEKDASTDQSSSEDIVYYIKQADKNPQIKAILLEIDSYGGSIVAAEEVASALRQAKKPTVAYIRESAASGAYWSATGANTIFASANSDVGGIGVTMSYMQNTEKNKKEGLEYIELSSAKFKNTGDPNRLLTNEEKKLLQRDLDILHENFVKAVAVNRNLSIEDVKKMADGSTMLGEMALQNKLIDKIGNFSEVKSYIKELINENVEICW